MAPSVSHTIRAIVQSIWDFIGIPFRLCLFPQEWLPRLGWTTLDEERFRAALPRLQGRVLDIGAGPNCLLKRYNDPQSVGVDVHDWGGGAMVVEDTANLPFEKESFDTVCFIACLNHIPNRAEVLQEARRLLRPDGRVIITMINPILGGIGHCIWWYGEHRLRGGMKEGEVGGLWTSAIDALCRECGFTQVEHKRFVYGMNHIYVYQKENTP